MPLDQNRLKGKIIDVLNQTRVEEDDPEASRDFFAQELAKAIVEEIKELQINYTSGLTAPNGPVTGTLENTTIS